MDRRELLLLGGVLLGSAGGLSAHDDSARWLARCFGDPGQLARVGQACFQQLAVGRAELPQLAGLQGLSGAQPEQLLQRFSAKREQDFLTGRIHRVGGWVMAESECALCALAAGA